VNAIVFRLSVYARVAAPLVFDDADRYAVIDALASAFAKRLLAYCLLDERLDIVAEGTETELIGLMGRALQLYLADRRRRAASGVPGLPARIDAERIHDAIALVQAINEVHELPLVAGRN
jgi:hypothetical protein